MIVKNNYQEAYKGEYFCYVKMNKGTVFQQAYFLNEGSNFLQSSTAVVIFLVQKRWTYRSMQLLWLFHQLQAVYQLCCFRKINDLSIVTHVVIMSRPDFCNGLEHRYASKGEKLGAEHMKLPSYEVRDCRVARSHCHTSREREKIF